MVKKRITNRRRPPKLQRQRNKLAPSELSKKGDEDRREGKQEKKWTPPEPDWVMCNVGMEFSKNNHCAGGAWVLRNNRGVVMCHSRRAFSGIMSRDDAKLTIVLWALESMRSQRQSNIIFAGEFGELFGALQRPQAWPSFSYQYSYARL
ncbi:hypothetical protein HID58_043732 [Brassica napus]|uniref:RNase H type-1 domain-containing protein n=1 Tax=Brassica napus TaxID=3708 RepID=A0ABQ8BHF1_BRANA|nr:hypothetical protein HID58_043732 [Brassica napus]